MFQRIIKGEHLVKVFESSVEELDTLAKSGNLGERAALLLQQRKEVLADGFMHLSFLPIYGEKNSVLYK